MTMPCKRVNPPSSIELIDPKVLVKRKVTETVTEESGRVEQKEQAD